MAFNELLKSLMKSQNMTQAELSEKSGVSISNIKKYTSGNRVPGVANVVRLAEALEVNVRVLAEAIDPMRMFVRALDKESKE